MLMKRNEPDPYGLKSNFPDYIILKVLINGEYLIILLKFIWWGSNQIRYS